MSSQGAFSNNTTTTVPSSSTVPAAAIEEPQFKPSDFSFLSQLFQILQKTADGDDAQEIATLSSNLKTSFKRCQTILDHLPGADLSPDEQARVLAEEMQILERKKAQLAEYLSWQVFDHYNPVAELPSQERPEEKVAEPTTTGLLTDDSGSLLADVVEPASSTEVKIEDMADIRPSQSTLETPSVDMQSPPAQGQRAPSQVHANNSLDISDVNMKDEDPAV